MGKTATPTKEAAPPAQDAPQDANGNSDEPEAPFKWAWRDGGWHKEDIGSIGDETFSQLLKIMPATAWNMLASMMDQAGVPMKNLEDAKLVKGFVLSLTRHPRYKPLLEDATKKRQA